jgi:hypothetical protein
VRGDGIKSRPRLVGLRSAKSSRVEIPAQLVQQAAAAGLADVEYLLEAVGAAVVRVGHFRVARGIGVERAEIVHARTLLVASRQRPQRSEHTLIHREDVVEAREVVGAELLCAAVEDDTAGVGGGSGAGVRRLVEMPGTGAGACDLNAGFESGVFHEALHHPFRGGRTADVPEADEADGERAIR